MLMEITRDALQPFETLPPSVHAFSVSTLASSSYQQDAGKVMEHNQDCLHLHRVFLRNKYKSSASNDKTQLALLNILITIYYMLFNWQDN